MILAEYELEPSGVASLVAATGGAGVADGPRRSAARVVSESGGRAAVEFVADSFDGDVGLLLASLVGEAAELASVSKCRLVGLDLPPGFLPGPAFGPCIGVQVGVIVKPSVGLSPREVAKVVAEAIGGGAGFVKDDELHANPPWCRLEDRVRAVSAVLEPGVTYCANISGPTPGVVERAQKVMALGATGILVNPFVHGLSALVALREANLGVPLFAHRTGSAAWTRGERFGIDGAVLAGLTRSCGADYVIVGAFGGKMFESDDQVHANLRAVRDPLGTIPAATAAMGGGLGPDGVAHQVLQAGGEGLVLLLGSAAYGYPGGLRAAVRDARDNLGAI